MYMCVWYINVCVDIRGIHRQEKFSFWDKRTIFLDLTMMSR